jgi:hypothetical protein
MGRLAVSEQIREGDVKRVQEKYEWLLSEVKE